MGAADDSRERSTVEPVGPAGEDSPEVERRVRKTVESYIPDLVKKTFYAGLGALLSTEEGIRKLTKETPKDVAGFLVNTASSGKDELVRIVSREIREFLQNVNLSEEIAKMLTTLSFEIKTEIRFIPNDEKVGGVKPDVKARARLKRSEDRKRRRRGRDEDAGEDEVGEESED